MESIKPKRKIDWARYIVTFIITAALFGTVMYLSQVVTSKRVAELKSIQDNIAIDLLSSETQFSLLSSGACTDDGNSILAPEIEKLGERLSFMEEQLGTDNADVIGLKKYYSLLQIKDFLLMKELAEKCGQKSVTIVYFYSNDADTCADCKKQGQVLTYLREQYPDLRVYAFDYDLDLSAIKTMQALYKVPNALPALVMNGKLHTGYQSVETIEKLIPDLKKMKAAQEAKEKAEAAKAKAAAEKAE
jgi:thiol-disulfide isomerase/thioredoxin